MRLTDAVDHFVFIGERGKTAEEIAEKYGVKKTALGVRKRTTGGYVNKEKNIYLWTFL